MWKCGLASIDYVEGYYMPEQRLLCAVLRRALLDIVGVYCTEFGMRERLREDALEWVWSERRGEWGFLWVCECLDLDPGRVRESIEGLSAVEIV